MKKLIISLGLLLILSTMAFGIDTVIRFGGVTNANQYNTGTTKQEAIDSYSTYSATGGVEITQSLLIAEIGGGVQYYGPVTGTDIAYAPVYGLVRFNLFPIAIKPYLVAKAGQVA